MLVQEANKSTTLRKSTAAPSSSSSTLSRPISPNVKLSGELTTHDNNIDINSSKNYSEDQSNWVNPTNSYQTFDDEGLIIPKRVIHPAGAQPIIKDLHRELKFNQTMGRSVLDQKSELKKALEKREDNKKKKQLEQDRLSRRTSLELRLEERAERLARESGESLKNDDSNFKHKTGGNTAPSSSPENGQQLNSPRNEFLEIHAKLCQHASDINEKVNDKGRFVKQDDSRLGLKPSIVIAKLPKDGFSVGDNKKVPGRSAIVN